MKTIQILGVAAPAVTAARFGRTPEHKGRLDIAGIKVVESD